jgi:hypothetical protein
VHSFVSILVLDLFLSILFNQLYSMLWPQVHSLI